MKRRFFIKQALGLGLAAASLTAPLAAFAASASGSLSDNSSRPNGPNNLEGQAKRWGLAVFSKRLGPVDLRRMVTACHQAHNVPEGGGEQGVKWLWSASYAEAFSGEVPEFAGRDTRQRRFPLLCNHCSRPACVRVCPSGAAFQRPDGIVAQDYQRCIGCRSCMAACPYGARSFNFSTPFFEPGALNPTYPPRPRGVVEKCNFCLERLERNLPPHCVAASGEALIFGNLADPASEISRVLKSNFSLTRHPGLGLGPAVYYIL